MHCNLFLTHLGFNAYTKNIKKYFDEFQGENLLQYLIALYYIIMMQI